MPPLTAANHEVRSRNVTASEVGALLGEHPFMTPGRIWDRLCGGIDLGSATSLSMEFGSRTEPILLDFAARALMTDTGWYLGNGKPPALRLNTKTFQHRRVPLCATPDALILNSRPEGSDRNHHGELVELKLSFSRDRWRDGLPKDIEWQARAQMACTRRDRVWVYVFSGQGKLYQVSRHMGKERQLTQAVSRFWADHVLTGIRPPDPAQPQIVYGRKGKK